MDSAPPRLTHGRVVSGRLKRHRKAHENNSRLVLFALDMGGPNMRCSKGEKKGAYMNWVQIIAEREAALGRRLTPDEAMALWREVRGQ